MGSKTKIKKGARGIKGEKGKEKKARVKSKIRKVVKRSGEVVPFNQKKITEAVYKAFCETREAGKKEAKQVSDKLVQLLNKNFKPGYIPQIEEIQDLVEKVLMILDFDETAKAYIIYRDKRGKLRDTESSLSEAVDLIESYIKEIDWQVKENANMAYSLQGLNNYVSSIVSSKYWMDRVYPKSIKRAHEEGDFHIHDLDKIAAYCCGWDLQDLLTKGFTGVSGKISCKPPKHFKAALGQMVNFFYTTQGETAGAQAFSNFDTLMAPFIRYDNLDYPAVKQAMQEFIFNLNVPTRVGFQTPFTNLTMDMTCHPTYKDQNVIIGGVPQKEKYDEFQEEMNLINRTFAEVMTEGDASGRIFTFPIPTYNIDKNFDWNDKRFDPIWEMTAKYGIPYFANFVNSDMNPEDARSMCCRLRLDNRELHKRMGGLFGAAPLTGSVGVVTINLPRIGYLAKDKKDYFKRLDELMDIAKESLETKRKIVEAFTLKGLYPYSKFYLENIFKRRGSYWGNHFSTIGLVGMNESLVNFMGEKTSSKKGLKFAEEILTHMREKMIKYQEETGNLYNLEATPAEGTSYRLALKDQKRFPKMIFANNGAVEKGAQPYYTNSSQLPVGHTDDIFEALDLQDSLQTKYTGGTVLHGFLGERIYDIETTKNLVRTIASKYHLPYFTLSPTFSVCPHHGYIEGEHKTCPKCVIEQKCEVYSRIVGYIRPVEQWNAGKSEEYKDRKEFVVVKK
ncbi:MAG: Oxygen-sensitive ribonucleoside-triphosphate reductase [Candidatus Moranbacteria bacterium GW2011_GWF2_36_839]|nr:MAG: Oxygen-sensitive ribonucleoside-triphosphate reductase [Candidatus Moranbacteria bacterium GW2011_GWF1_36_78]KKQ17313.1 MAG: Oxygen-sensitive ribonucleoside-triphosphate reductase [Candidatus Moranbacteria bacterium GW2011_GWF2_36_839]HAT73842.1 ribonucleoside triphosphate reductase [Candidatus Moranbacteria bacterium]HBY11015.1 ribonucleoside triphosphate reductase [Candidatus Moranbacteria bacterium]